MDVQKEYKIKGLESFFLIAIIFVFPINYNVVGYYAQSEHVDFGYYFLSPVDKIIPYTDLFLFFYCTVYLIPIAVVIHTISIKGYDINILRKLLCAVLCMELLSFLCFLIIPTSCAPLLATAPNQAYIYFPQLTNAFNSTIMPLYNAFPSIHVMSSRLFILYYFFIIPTTFKYKSFLGRLLLVNFFLVVVSTVTLKYHYLVDLLAGFLLANFIFTLCFLKNFFQVEKWSVILGQKNLILIEFLVLLFVLISLVLSYPNHISLGH